MKTPDTTGGRITEMVMAALRQADVLKPDEPGHPTHYNRAYSAVLRTLDPYSEPCPPEATQASRAVPATTFPNNLGNYRRRK